MAASTVVVTLAELDAALDATASSGLSLIGISPAVKSLASLGESAPVVLTFANIAPPSFTFTVNTANTSTGSTAADHFKLPLFNGGVYDFNVDWGDGSNDDITAYNDAAADHAYASAGTYTVKITGTITGWKFNNTGDRLKILDVSEWGPLTISSNVAFYNCTNLTSSASDGPKLAAGITDIQHTFDGCVSLNVNVSGWDVSTVVNFMSTFANCAAFNSNVSGWNVSNGTNFSNMFVGCHVFNQNLSGWNVSKSTTFQGMFYDCFVFESDVSGWSVSNCTKFIDMFHTCHAFTSDVSGWDVSKSDNLAAMFYQCYGFTSDLSGWDVSLNTNFHAMFGSCANFTSDLSGWNVSNGTLFHRMFEGCTSFNSNLSAWRTPLGTDFTNMFAGCSSLVSDLSGWNVSSATNFTGMFFGCSLFDSNLSAWNVSGVTNFTSFMQGVTLSTSNYDATLIGWDALTLQSGKSVNFGGSKYTSGGAAEAARSDIISTYGWTIADGGAA